MKKAICIALTVMLVMSLCMIPSMAADENVALGKPVTGQTDTPDTVIPAMEDNNFWGAAFLTDGIIKDFDTTQDGGPIALYGAVSTAVGPAMSADIIVDLQGKFDINTIKLYPAGFLQGQNLPEEFSVAASEDGNNWTTVATETGVTARKFDNPFVYEKKLTAKFVKIHVAKASQVADDAWFYYGFSELEVFGTKASDAPAGDAAPAYDSSLVYSSSTGNNIGVWLKDATNELTTVFNVDKPFNELKLDVFWASNPPANGTALYNFKISLYKFSYNVANTLAGTPVASAEIINGNGDNNKFYNDTPAFEIAGNNMTLSGSDNGLKAVLGSDLPAGQYVLYIINDAGEGSYLVLPTGEGDLAPVKYFRGTAEGEPIRFALNTAGQFVDLIPDSEVPAPQTGDMAVAMFAVIAVVALAAVVVFKKRVNA